MINARFSSWLIGPHDADKLAVQAVRGVGGC